VNNGYPRLPDLETEGRGFWYGLWTGSKAIAVLLICIPIAVLMLTSSQPTSTPTAPVPATPTGIVALPTAGPSPTPLPKRLLPVDTTVAGTLIYVQGHSLVRLQGDSSPQPLVAGAAQPALSPNRKKLAYVRLLKNWSDIYTYDLNSGTSTPLTNDSLRIPGDDRTGLSAGSPTWTQDGKSLLFTWNAPGFIPGESPETTTNQTDLSIYRCSITPPCDANNAQLIVNSRYSLTGGATDPAPRPADPDTFAYSLYATNTLPDGSAISQPTLYARSLSTGAATALSAQGEAASEPSWNPSGRELAFVKTDPSENTNAIYAMPFHAPGSLDDYTHATLLIRGTPLVSYPTFSPDGRWLAYLANDDAGNGFHLYIARVHLGRHPTLEKPHIVARAGTMDSDRLAWLP